MGTFKDFLNKKLESESFKKAYEEENILADIAIKIAISRKELHYTQEALSIKAGVTQQQVSKVEGGENCQASTLIKVCRALDLKLEAVAN